MAPNYCMDCGGELVAGAKFCSECGAEVGEAGTTQNPPSQHQDTAARGGDPTMFRATVGLFVGYLVFVVLGLVLLNSALFVLAGVCVIISLITMYVDLIDLEGRLWDTRPVLWIVAGVLAYIVVTPLYVYKRRQVPPIELP